MKKFNMPADLCSPKALGTIRKEMGAREENFIANICNIKDTSDEILHKFKEVTLAQSITPEAPVDVMEEIRAYNTKLLKIKNIAAASQISAGEAK